MFFVPGGFGEGDLDNGWVDGIAAALVFQRERGVRERQLLRAQPAAQLHDQPARAGLVNNMASACSTRSGNFPARALKVGGTASHS